MAFTSTRTGLRAAAALLGATIAAALGPHPLAAQAPTTYYACYVPSSGTVYRIKEPGLRQECGTSTREGRLETHVPFSWIAAPTPCPGSDARVAAKGGPKANGLVLVATASAVGFGGITNFLKFLSPPAVVTVTGSATVVVSSSKALGSYNEHGGNGLTVDMCYAPSGTSTLTTAGVGAKNLETPPNTRMGYSLSAVLTLEAGTYDVGMCGFSSDASSWNNLDTGQTTALVFAKG